MDKKINKYLGQHVFYNALVNMIAGIGIGILITYPFVGIHPMRWGIALIIIGLAGNMLPAMMQKGK